MIRKSNAGQGLIESIVMLPLGLLIISMMFKLIYRGALYHYTHYQLHEALLCQEAYPLQLCKETLRKKLQTYLIFKEPFQLELSSQRSAIRGEVYIELDPPLTVAQSLRKTFYDKK